MKQLRHHAARMYIARGGAYLWVAANPTSNIHTYIHTHIHTYIDTYIHFILTRIYRVAQTMS
jgi:hypothetical protein